MRSIRGKTSDYHPRRAWDCPPTAPLGAVVVREEAPEVRKAGYYQGAMARLRKARGGRCEAHLVWPGALREPCPRTEKLEFAHRKVTEVNGRGRGRSKRYHEIKKNPDWFWLLCRPHHAKQEVDVALEKMRNRPVFRERVPGEDDDEED